jgi:hypothetical protein
VNRITITLEGPDAAEAVRELLSAIAYDGLDVTVRDDRTATIELHSGGRVVQRLGGLPVVTDADVDKLIEVLQRGDA